MHRFRRLLALTAVAGLSVVLVACGDDDDDDVSTASDPPAADTSAPAATEATPSTVAATGETAAPVVFEGEEAAAAEAWSSVFDSALPATDKAPHLQEAEALAPTLEAYAAAGEQFGGIALAPTAVAITGDTATVTYDILFAGQPAYTDQAGEVVQVGDTWQVTRDQFCSFMSLARTPCP